MLQNCNRWQNIRMSGPNTQTHTQAAAAAQALAFRSDMMDYYKTVPAYYLKPLKAVLRKANASSSVQIPVPEFREHYGEEATKPSSAALPVAALAPALKARLDHLKLEHLKLEKSKVLCRLLTTCRPQSLCRAQSQFPADFGLTYRRRTKSGPAAGRAEEGLYVRTACRSRCVDKKPFLTSFAGAKRLLLQGN